MDTMVTHAIAWVTRRNRNVDHAPAARSNRSHEVQRVAKTRPETVGHQTQTQRDETAQWITHALPRTQPRGYAQAHRREMPKQGHTVATTLRGQAISTHQIGDIFS